MECMYLALASELLDEPQAIDDAFHHLANAFLTLEKHPDKETHIAILVGTEEEISKVLDN